MIASLILTALLLVVLGFYGLVRLQMSACEGGVYHEPLSNAEEWSASLDVALGLDMWSTTEAELVDLEWDMLPMVGAWGDVVTTIPMVKRTTSMTVYMLRDMCYV